MMSVFFLDNVFVDTYNAFETCRCLHIFAPKTEVKLENTGLKFSVLH